MDNILNESIYHVHTSLLVSKERIFKQTFTNRRYRTGNMIYRNRISVRQRINEQINRTNNKRFHYNESQQCKKHDQLV